MRRRQKDEMHGGQLRLALEERWARYALPDLHELDPDALPSDMNKRKPHPVRLSNPGGRSLPL
jgi:hypothetical protein